MCFFECMSFAGWNLQKNVKEMSENYIKTVFAMTKNIIRDSKILKFYVFIPQSGV